MKKSKIVNNNIVRVKDANIGVFDEDRPIKKAAWFDEYTDIVTFKRLPVHDVYLDRLAEELMKWIKEDTEALTVDEFISNKGIYWKDFNRFTTRHENLRIAYEEAKRIVGRRREVGALKKTLDSNIVIRSLTMYNEEWKENVAWHATLNKKETAETKQTIVVLEKFPEPESN